MFALKHLYWYNSSTHDFHAGGVIVENGRLVKLGELTHEESMTAEDCGGGVLLPGMVDAHTHGRAGMDFCNADSSQLDALRKAYALVGTTTVAPTLASDTEEGWEAATRRIEAAGFPAIHYEGRYLSPEKRGAHNPALLTNPKIDECDRLMAWAGSMRVHFTLAPELPGAEAFIRHAVERDATVGIGHTAADYDTAMKALSCGATSFSHTFNCMPPLLHRDPGTVGAALTTDTYAECICDGIHMHPATVRLMYRAKGRDRLVLVTDSMMAAGLGDGVYTLAGQEVHVGQGVARTGDGALAGSTLHLLQAVRNLMKFADISLADALPCATVNPARMLGLDEMTGQLRVGAPADMLLVTPEAPDAQKLGELRAVWVGGRRYL